MEEPTKTPGSPPLEAREAGSNPKAETDPQGPLAAADGESESFDPESRSTGEALASDPQEGKLQNGKPRSGDSRGEDPQAEDQHRKDSDPKDSLPSPGLTAAENEALQGMTEVAPHVGAGGSQLVAIPEIDLHDPRLYVNRELSLLEFNRRVLEQAKNKTVPLLERLRFLSICSTNLDEFFEVRAAGLRQQVKYDIARPGADGLSPQETLAQIHRIASRIVREQYRVLNDELLPQLAQEGICVHSRSAWTEDQRRWVKQYFRTEVAPVLTPMGLDPSHPFPRVVNKSLNFFVSLKGKDAFGRDSRLAVVPVPRSLPRLIPFPQELAEGQFAFAMLSSVIHAHIDEIFPGMSVTGCFQFRVTRDSDLWVDEEEIEDLMLALKVELQTRHLGDAVRLEVADNCEEDLARFLLENFDLDSRDCYRVNGPVNLHRLVAIYDKVDRPDLKYPPFFPGTPKRVSSYPTMFEALRAGDIVLHHPYESFKPVLELARQAARDPDVLAIRQTLYRVGDDSPLVEALIEAAMAGKEVAVVVELRARFDEAANIKLATRLQEAGAKVVYGVVGYKTHAKLMLVVRREAKKLRRYVHLGTGNYHAGTARAYTDLALLTADPKLGEDVHKLFNQLTGLGRTPPLEKMLQSPFSLHKTLLRKIRQEAENAREGKKAWIRAKMNSLSEPKLIRELYRASQAGVQVDLIVRGICCLRPGIPGVSENIRVRSIVGRFLEHSRIFSFYAEGEKEVWASSADWMPRNLFSRVEACFPIEESKMRSRVAKEMLLWALNDDTQAWIMNWDGSYHRAMRSAESEPYSLQSALLKKLGAGG